MQVISFINMKGGVGKTTLAVNVAYGLAFLHQKRVLLVDGDPQFNATQYLLEDNVYLQHTEDSKKGTLADIFIPRPAGPINTVKGQAKGINRAKMSLSQCTCAIFDGGPGKGKLDLLPSSLTLMYAETSPRGTEAKLKVYLQEKASGYDYVLIDCPPAIFSIFTQAAILASDSYLVPIKPDPLSVVGLPMLERWLEEYTDDAGLKIDLVGLVFTLVRSPLPGRMGELMDDIRQRRKEEVFTAYLAQSTDVATSVERHLPIFQYKSNSKTAIQVEDITKEFLDRTSGA